MPLHLIENEKELEIIETSRILKIPIYLQYYKQPFYRKIHSVFIEEIKNYFKQHLANNNS